ncbi:serine threonine-protein kinase [Musa troglodytarum]|uniref:Serine threonine-protein kinase n=1 Tax=Musa troglodytarum TaxID=320322 RepID=A0A9E7EGB5_9LILI|nr:serine threonine-protein kinase [Musa troglodytarum]
MKATTLSLLDPKLKGNADEKELGRACRMAWWCIQDVECRRPSTGEVVEQQEGELGVSLPPIPGLLESYSSMLSRSRNRTSAPSRIVKRTWTRVIN